MSDSERHRTRENRVGAHRRLPRALLVLACCGSLLLTGCGGGGGPTKAGYDASASTICRSASAHDAALVKRLGAAIGSLGSGGRNGTHELAGVLAQLQGAAAATSAKLGGLEPPPGGRGATERLSRSLATIDGILGRAAAAAAAGNAQTALGELQQAAPAAQEMVAAAKAYGATGCESLLAGMGAAGAKMIHASIVGEDHEPVVGRAWHYRVTVSDAEGHPLSGTETTRYTFGGSVVGTEKPQNVAFRNGVYRDTIEFPPAAVGYPLDVQAVVHVSLGSVTLEWPVRVRQ